MGNRLADLLQRRGRLVADGGMGTSLFEMGLQAGSTPELWNIAHPDRVAEVHSEFVGAGADIILTNTFGGTRARLDLDGLGHRVAELNEAGVSLARAVAEGARREVIVAGSVGPTGQLFAPLGELTHDTGVELFTEQVTALASAGADVIWIETLSAIEELAAAVEAAETTGLPVVSTMSFDTHGKTMMGLAPSRLAGWWGDHGSSPTAIGANCGVGPGDVVIAVDELRETGAGYVLVAKANCGVPQMIGGTLWYPTSSDDMSAYAELALDAGALIVGACCGSIPEHIGEIRAVVDSHEAKSGVDVVEVASRLGGQAGAATPTGGRGRERRSRRRTSSPI
ncbi:MAG TPA: betaine--homocysteine S-methyltransferase [Acidimicrobiia bacterium]|nr:betaine--homocysteine S-methyltransferase [Acidimicrobiia bacterium]